eukprot:CAMPEP_0201592036 /NCGR_PEP_ID=MMETSP0190_2-20130828/190037_1 /ASSEMBLY_ACC=CAM_ASM_000263 /TAXON_ID=37353 /ORGANISM="Rosalina sp." /LENGTH=378 /DNA_ID=CAMNT_0048050617 /DNA_START=17 /DNA_END=1150 /DNA_ORIENTATION=+
MSYQVRPKQGGNQQQGGYQPQQQQQGGYQPQQQGGYQPQQQGGYQPYQPSQQQGGYQPQQQGGYQPQQQQGGYQVRQKQAPSYQVKPKPPQQGGQQNQYDVDSDDLEILLDEIDREAEQAPKGQKQAPSYQVKPKPPQQNQYDVDSDDLEILLDEIDREAEQAPKDDMIVGDALSQVRDEMNAKFTNIAQTMESQLARLKQQIAKQKQVNTQLKQKISLSDKQRDEFKQEAQKQTNDLSQLNGLYTNDAPQDQYQNLVNGIVQRHQQFQQALQQQSYPQNVGAMNKAWQDEIYKISQLIANSPGKAEFATLVDEMKNRTRELNTLRQIESGQMPYSAIADIVDQCEERHAAMVGDQMSSYKSPGVLTDQTMINNNKQW